ncbi:hypothetical protein KP509_1Z124900 [Ceratopteris richardii]|nr:hypothetical protein KP509_1Z124900 [Ceratopteris richardii]
MCRLVIYTNTGNSNRVLVREEKEYYQRLVECHKPKILNLELGEAIVVRNVGGFVAAYGEEGTCPSCHVAIEYAVKELQIEHILVIGHTDSDAIQSLMKVHDEEKSHFSEHFKNWLNLCERTCEKVKQVHSSKSIAEQCTLCEKECIDLSMQNLLTYPFVKEAVSANKISIHAGLYDMHNCTFDHGSLDYSDTESEKYH